MSYDVIIAGAGFAGSTAARVLADAGKKVLILEKRNHIGGNAYDWTDENDVLRHEYGPHIFHTNSEKAIEFLSRFTDWYTYEHRVLGYIKGKLVPIPFNLTSIEKLFDEDRAEHLKQVLIASYGADHKIPILELRQNWDPEIRELADFIYENVFQYYTMKQWGLQVEEIDPAVTGRVPVLISYDDRYFQDSFQQMPSDGYTKLFERMLDHGNIEVQLNVDIMDRMTVNPEEGTVYFDNELFTGTVIYTGLLDHLLGYQLGDLPYRSLDFDVETKEGNFQPVATVNYPTPAENHPYTRITEYKKFMKNPPIMKTTIAIEYPMAYDRNGEKGNVPYYPIFNEASQKQYDAYADLVKKIPNIVPLGRLAEYKYFNMDAIVEHAIDVAEGLLGK